MPKKVKLIPVAMVRPNKDFVQTPSRLRPSVELTQEEFNKIADTAKTTSVSFEPDGVSNPQQTTAYAVPIEVQGGLKGWVQRCIVSKK